MTNKTITLPRELVEDLLDGFLDPRCTIAEAIQAALADPVPPAGGDDLVECDACPTSGGCVRTCMKADPTPPTVGNPEIQRWSANWHMEDFYKSPHGTHVDYDDHAAIVTLLQAEVKGLKALRAESHANFLDYSDLLHDVACSHNWVISDELRTRITETLNVFATPGQAPADSYAAIRKERDALQSELTKARELLVRITGPSLQDQGKAIGEAVTLLSNQSAPADKGQGEPVAEIVSKFGDPEAFGERELIALKDISKFPYGTKLYAVQPAPVAADLSELREYHAKAERELKAYADDDGLRDSDVKHYMKRAAVHRAFVAAIDGLRP